MPYMKAPNMYLAQLGIEGAVRVGILEALPLRPGTLCFGHV